MAGVNDPCARCGASTASQGPLCAACASHGPLTPDEARRARLRAAEEPGAVVCPDCGSAWPGAVDDQPCTWCGLTTDDLKDAAAFLETFKERTM